MNKYGFGLSSMLLLWAYALSVFADSNPPQYQAEPCCQLCPDAPANRNPLGLHKGMDGWLFPAATKETTDEWLSQRDRQHLLSLFVRQMAIKGSRLMLIMPPPRTLMHANKQQISSAKITPDDYQQTLAYFRQAGFLVPAYETLQPEQSGSSSETFFFKRDPRWTSAGAHQTAELVATAIRQLPVFKKLTEQTFVTRVQGWLKINGTLNHQALASCDGLHYPLEYTPHFVTQNTSINVAESLDDIVLIGSRQSVANRFNFDGFLQQALARNVSNRTTPEGDSSVGWMNLLMSASFQHRSPALILWELPYEQRHLTASLLRQLIAQVNNGCDSSTLLEHSEKMVQGKKLDDLVFTKQLLKTNPSELIVDLKLSDPSIDQLMLTIWYSDGGKGEFQIRKNTQRDNTSRFSFVLGNTATSQQRFFVALDLSLMGTTNSNTKISTNVCRLPSKLLPKTEI
jgi:alginate biosynthesis protein AlgX